MELKNLIIFLCVVCYCESVILSRCDIARGLIQRGFNKARINDWVCLAEAESGRNTKAVNKKNKNGSWDYGLFQLNSMYWCQGQKTKENACKLRCSALLTNSLDPSAKCALKVYKRQGFKAWYGWRSKCQNRNISFYTKGCKL